MNRRMDGKLPAGRAALAAGAVVIALAPMAAPLLAVTHPLLSLAVQSFFAGLCHQEASRSFVLRGLPVAVCVRCLGIYWGAALGCSIGCMERVQRLAGPAAARSALIGALTLNFLDVAAELFHLHGNLPWPRFALGLLLGGCAGLLACAAAKREQQRRAPFEASYSTDFDLASLIPEAREARSR